MWVEDIKYLVSATNVKLALVSHQILPIYCNGEGTAVELKLRGPGIPQSFSMSSAKTETQQTVEGQILHLDPGPKAENETAIILLEVFI